ncbi:threonine/serine ThrE exporter family protein [Lactococcus petauri]|uniref:threonine/serine ThrE exporter family protein n=1 Tax=Lactococcus petauri TaxID=1940789 RepID=UPI0025506C28|nr:threonine/serine exporter family protein [Lactococcus petauri]
MTNSEIMNISSKTGVLLLSGGAESFRIEETVEYVGEALGLDITCYVTLTAVMVSTKDGTSSTVKKVRISGFNLQTVDEVNDISRKLVSKKITPEQYDSKLTEIESNVKDYPILYKVIASGFVSMAPSLFSQVSLKQYVLMFIIGMLGFTSYIFVKNRVTIPHSPEFTGSFLIGILVLLSEHLRIIDAPASVIFGSVMPLVPGLSITNSIREIILGEAISGIVRAIDAILVVSALATGITASLEIMDFV